MRLWFALLLALVSSNGFAQADYAREQRWAAAITPAILVGDTVPLTLKDGRKFLGIYAPNAKARAGVVLVHGLGMHPDWSVVHPLRSQLAEQDYATLSVQMPVMAAGVPGEQYSPLFPEAAARIAVSVQYLRNKGHAKMVLVSHNYCPRMPNVPLHQDEAHAITAWGTIGSTD